MNSLNLVRDYFDRAAHRFESIYENNKPAYQKAVDRVFRQVVVERFHLICSLAPVPGEWKVLDVGCGPGKYSVKLAELGAAKVVGVDVSDKMIELARAEADSRKLGAKCDFTVASFLDFSTQEKFEVIVATGYFDYLEDPLTHLKKMIRHSSGRLFLSFPKRWEVRVPIRKLRFFVERGYVRFYTKSLIQRLFRQAGVPEDQLTLVDLGRDWIAVASTGFAAPE